MSNKKVHVYSNSGKTAWKSCKSLIFECPFAGTFVFIWRFTVQKIRAVSVLRKKQEPFAV